MSEIIGKSFDGDDMRIPLSDVARFLNDAGVEIDPATIRLADDPRKHPMFTITCPNCDYEYMDPFEDGSFECPECELYLPPKKDPRKAMLDKSENFLHDKTGYCYYSIKPEKAPLIYGLYIEPEHRGRGNAFRLLEATIRMIREAGCWGGIEIEARPTEAGVERERLAAFYKKMGLIVILDEMEAKL